MHNLTTWLNMSGSRDLPNRAKLNWRNTLDMRGDVLQSLDLPDEKESICIKRRLGVSFLGNRGSRQLLVLLCHIVVGGDANLMHLV